MAYIDRDKTLIALHSMHTLRLIGERDETDKLFDMMLEIIQKQPTADVEEVKHGEWIIENNERDWKDKDTYRLSIKCSECGKTHFLGTTKYQNEYDKEKLKTLGTYGDYSFCGKCGAKMDGKKG